MTLSACRLDRHQICAFSPAQTVHSALILPVLNYLGRTAVRIVSLRWKDWMSFRGYFLIYILDIAYSLLYSNEKSNRLLKKLCALCLQGYLWIDPIHFPEISYSMQIWPAVCSWINFLICHEDYEMFLMLGILLLWR